MALDAKVDVFTLNTSTGNQSVSGVGFQPKVVFFFASPLTTDGIAVDFNISMGVGMSSSKRGVIGFNDEDGVANTDVTRCIANTRVIQLLDPGRTTIICDADFVSLDSDGFTINITTAPGSAYQVNFLALGGTDLTNVDVGSFSVPGATGNQAITGVGFQPDAVMFLGNGDPYTGSPGNDGAFNVGFAKSTTERATLSVASDNANANGYNHRGLWTDGCFSDIYYTDGTLHGKADLVSLDSDGFTINWSVLPGSTDDIIYIAFKGGNYAIGTIDSGTSLGSFSKTGLGFQGAAGFFLSIGNNSIGSINTGMELSIGIANASTDDAVIGGVSEHGSASTNTDIFIDSSLVYKNYDLSQTLEGSAGFISWDSDGFTLAMNDADPSANKILYFVIGGAATPKDSITPLAGNLRKKRFQPLLVR